MQVTLNKTHTFPGKEQNILPRRENKKSTFNRRHLDALVQHAETYVVRSWVLVIIWSFKKKNYST